MTTTDSIILRELPVIRQIIHDETWLEGERRGCCVMSDDQMVRENVCRVVLSVGAQLRESATRQLAAPPAWLPDPTMPEAA